ncbi:MAG TPA: universal stress protein, partial [Maribacter sp.]|nr:universal stress protein [Maribacter sp.]
LIPIDFSNNSWNALEYAVQLFKSEPCNFFILHIDELNKSDENGNSFLVIAKPSPTTIKDKMNRFVERIGNLPSNVAHQFIALKEYGDFIDLIKKTVQEKKIDLIVMGTKNIFHFKATVFGSNIGNVITKVPCNVLVIPEGTALKKPKKIAFPTDFNLFYSYPILHSLTEILEISNAYLEVVHVSQSQPIFTNSQVNNKEYLNDYLHELFSNSHSFQSILGANIRDSIINYISSNEIEMLTMVAKNLNLFQQLFINNSTDHLSYHTSVPLMVIHE